MFKSGEFVSKKNEGAAALSCHKTGAQSVKINEDFQTLSNRINLCAALKSFLKPYG